MTPLSIRPTKGKSYSKGLGEKITRQSDEYDNNDDEKKKKN